MASIDFPDVKSIDHFHLIPSHNLHFDMSTFSQNDVDPIPAGVPPFLGGEEGEARRFHPSLILSSSLYVSSIVLEFWKTDRKTSTAMARKGFPSLEFKVVQSVSSKTMDLTGS
ncbi:unnamed protein product [Eruca vesicaria subsp. sativa]|uniref:Uncharacterized protein n=1 Tax=Eruca vesicaria subsp. sativa TaxID=29727 RepID=A0ABC8KDN7_ERUVS|nr:unnamed protein product [Eruca vesicaria subsp. sativa]